MPICVKVEKRYAENLRKMLIRRNLVDKSFKIFSEGDYVLIPVTSKEKVVHLVKKMGIDVVVVECSPPRRGYVVGLGTSIPSYDIIGDVVIIREKAIDSHGDVSKLVETIRKINPRVKAIYVKEYTDTVYRISRLRLLWGQDVDEVIAKEYGLRFFVKLKDVYYNPRLSTEHRRIAEKVFDGEIVFDLFSGIGGFAIHIASLHNVTVFANDLNPKAITCLLKNIHVNRKRLKGKIIVSLNNVVNVPLLVRKGIADRIIANLPHSSLNYFSIYNHLAHKDTVMHLYVLGDEETVNSKLGFIESNNWVVERITPVLDYAPYKFIYRIDVIKR